ncbi:conserved protein of unknown function [Rhodovastum atsumiense]|uniref:hypothetical protein n=1 Tax=Rhodovastum atsumiense TaxID=504468 RepID=UPI002024710C|nr:hypothetical protein [Rhodovastum atsumiense]CAH2602934.1 conserved protein of unknown function [Rhodovastum atsumiense]
MSGFGGVPYRFEACEIATDDGVVAIPDGVAFVPDPIGSGSASVEICFSYRRRTLHLSRSEWDRVLTAGLAQPA